MDMIRQIFTMSLVALILLVLKTSLFLSVFALGLKASFADATFLLRRPREIGRAFLAMNLLMPLVAFLLAITFDLNPAVKIALVTVSVSPVPPVFPKKALKIGCKENYAVGLLVAAGLLSVVLVPATMELFRLVTNVPLQMSVSSVAEMVFVTILLPLLLGIGVRRLAPLLAEPAAPIISTAASLLLVLGLLPVLFSAAKTMLSLVGNGTLLSFSVFAIVGLLVGHFLGGPDPENRSVLALAAATRHPGIAVAIAHANFPDQKLAVPAVFLYTVVGAILAGLYPRLTAHKKTSPAETPKQVAV
jgi:bile acid:Na+ symporter, BASS family